MIKHWKKLSNVKIAKFRIKENTSAWELQKSLINSPEVKLVLESEDLVPIGFSFSGLYFPQLGRHFSVETSQMSVKAILNNVIEKSPTARCWLMKRYGNDGSFYIRLAARYDESASSR